MLRHFSANKAARTRAQWMALYEEKVTEACPELAGHVDWDTAVYLYMMGRSVIDAADSTIAGAKAASAA